MMEAFPEDTSDQIVCEWLHRVKEECKRKNFEVVTVAFIARNMNAVLSRALRDVVFLTEAVLANTSHANGKVSLQVNVPIPGTLRKFFEFVSAVDRFLEAVAKSAGAAPVAISRAIRSMKVGAVFAVLMQVAVLPRTVIAQCGATTIALPPVLADFLDEARNCSKTLARGFTLGQSLHFEHIEGAVMQWTSETLRRITATAGAAAKAPASRDILKDEQGHMATFEMAVAGLLLERLAAVSAEACAAAMVTASAKVQVSFGPPIGSADELQVEGIAPAAYLAFIQNLAEQAALVPSKAFDKNPMFKVAVDRALVDLPNLHARIEAGLAGKKIPAAAAQKTPQVAKSATNTPLNPFRQAIHASFSSPPCSGSAEAFSLQHTMLRGGQSNASPQGWHLSPQPSASNHTASANGHVQYSAETPARITSNAMAALASPPTGIRTPLHSLSRPQLSTRPVDGSLTDIAPFPDVDEFLRGLRLEARPPVLADFVQRCDAAVEGHRPPNGVSWPAREQDYHRFDRSAVLQRVASPSLQAHYASHLCQHAIDPSEAQRLLQGTTGYYEQKAFRLSSVIRDAQTHNGALATDIARQRRHNRQLERVLDLLGELQSETGRGGVGGTAHFVSCLTQRLKHVEDEWRTRTGRPPPPPAAPRGRYPPAAAARPRQAAPPRVDDGDSPVFELNGR